MRERKWSPVPGYEGIYEVSDTGLVRSLDRTICNVNGVKRFISGKLTTLNTDDNGRITVHLWKNNKSKTFRTYELVLLAFIGDKPIGHQVCHIDGNKLNNCLSNLKYGTPKENIHDKKSHGTFYPRRGKHLTAKDVIEIRKRVTGFKFSQIKHLAEEYNISSGALKNIFYGYTWKNLGE